jgi:hypothetical protein
MNNSSQFRQRNGWGIHFGSLRNNPSCCFDFLFPAVLGGKKAAVVDGVERVTDVRWLCKSRVDRVLISKERWYFPGFDMYSAQTRAGYLRLFPPLLPAVFCLGSLSFPVAQMLGQRKNNNNNKNPTRFFLTRKS